MINEKPVLITKLNKNKTHFDNFKLPVISLSLLECNWTFFKRRLIGGHTFGWHCFMFS